MYVYMYAYCDARTVANLSYDVCMYGRRADNLLPGRPHSVPVGEQLEGHLADRILDGGRRRRFLLRAAECSRRQRKCFLRRTERSLLKIIFVFMHRYTVE
jgi:hypothetical protein